MLLDRYLVKRMIRPFLSVIAIVVMLLSLENSSRLMTQLENVERPFAVLMRFMGFLLPEYLGIALVFALFIGISMSLRGLALSGEFDIFAAVGLAPFRMLRTPLAIAGLCAIAFLLTRGFLEPWGERRLDAFGSAVRAGDLGMAINAGEFYSLAGQITFHADRIGADHRSFQGVLVRANDYAVYARSARAINGGRDGLLVILQDGQLVREKSGQLPSVVRFTEFRLPLPNNRPMQANGTTLRDSNRIYFDQLWRTATKGAGQYERYSARSAIAARLGVALALPLLPFLAIGLSIPPKRQTGAFGIGFGILALVIFIKAVHGLEPSASPNAVWQIALLWCGLASVSFWSWRMHVDRGPGYLEGRFTHVLRPAFDRLAAFLSFSWTAETPSAGIA